MQAVSFILNILISALNIYSLLCMIRIILTWIPGISYSPFARFLSQLCDPYLNLFRGIRWLRMGSFDFSPAIAMVVLQVAANLLSNIGRMSRLSVGVLLATLLSLAWSIASSIINFIIILLVVRLLILLIGKQDYNSTNPFLNQIDSSLNPLMYRISRTFSGGRPISFKAGLIISAVSLFVVQAAGGILIFYLENLLSRLPF